MNEDPKTPNSPQESGVSAPAEGGAEKGVFKLGANGDKTSAPKTSFLQKLVRSGDKREEEQGGENQFTKLFGAQDEFAPADAASISQLLGPKPVFVQKTYIEQEQKRRKAAKNVFTLSVIMALAVYGFFYSQLNADFTYLGQNAASEFESSNALLERKQTELNNLRYRKAVMFLDDTNGEISSYQIHKDIINSQRSSAAEKEQAQTALEETGERIKVMLAQVQAILNESMGVDVYSPEPVAPDEREAYFEQLLRDSLVQTRAAASGSDSRNREMLRIIDNVIRFIDNRSFRDTLRMQDLGKMAAGDQEFDVLLARIRAQGTDELALINKVQTARLDWTSVINNIHEAVIGNVDNVYGRGFFQENGGFLFNSYGFDAKTRRISISGVTKTPNTKTFTGISNLLEAIKCSPHFKDIDFRSFAKSKDEGGFYSSSVNLEFALQDESETEQCDRNPRANSPSATNPAIDEPTVNPS